MKIKQIKLLIKVEKCIFISILAFQYFATVFFFYEFSFFYQRNFKLSLNHDLFCSKTNEQIYNVIVIIQYHRFSYSLSSQGNNMLISYCCKLLTENYGSYKYLYMLQFMTRNRKASPFLKDRLEVLKQPNTYKTHSQNF